MQPTRVGKSQTDSTASGSRSSVNTEHVESNLLWEQSKGLAGVKAGVVQKQAHQAAPAAALVSAHHTMHLIVVHVNWVMYRLQV